MLDAGGSFPPATVRPMSLPKTRASARPVSAAELPDLNRTSAERVREALAEAWSYYSYARFHDEGSNYLQNRGIFVVDLEAELGRPVVGHTPHKSPDQLIARLKEKGFTDDELVDAGLARHTTGRPMIDAFRDRVVVPGARWHRGCGWVHRPLRRYAR